MPSTACLWLLLLLLFQMPLNPQGSCNPEFSSQILLSLGSCHPDQGDLLFFATPNYPISAISIHFFHLLLLYLKSPLPSKRHCSVSLLLKIEACTGLIHTCHQTPAWLSLLSFPFSSSGYWDLGDLRVTWASLCWRLFYVLHESHSSLTLVFHTEWQSTKLLAHFSQAHAHIDKKSFREYQKCTDYFETRYIKCDLYWLYAIHSSCWPKSTGSFSNVHFILTKFLLGILQ